MAEEPSDTQDHQRFNEMLVHLTPLGASVPYTVCYDPNGDIWVASKGGLFKFDGKNPRKVVFKKKNPFPNKMSAFPQIVLHEDTLIYTCAEHKDGSTQFYLMNLEGEEKHMQIVDGFIQSLVVNSQGDIYCTKAIQGEYSTVWSTSIDAPLGWEELVSSREFIFETLGLINDECLLASTVQLPKNMYSKQALRIISVPGARVGRSFSEAGREPGKIHFPRAITRLGEHMLVMDKSGRFQRFTDRGEYVDTIAEIDAYLANGFTLTKQEASFFNCKLDMQKLDGDTHQRALVVMSGVVRDTDRQAICDDWLEYVKLDGSSWKDIPRP